MSSVETIQNMLNTSTANNYEASKSELGKNDFLNLMMAQLKYQDPMNPMDGSQYSAQLAQFSSLEQLQNMNENMETSISANYALTASINNTMTAALIGKEVKLGTDTIKFNGQESAAIGYELPDNAQKVEVKIYNDLGALVKTIKDAPTDIGKNKLSWDFTDDNGKTVKNGKYSYEITATNSSKEELTFDSYLIGDISSVRYTEEGTKIVINDVEYTLDQITEILNSDAGSGEDA